jgi:protein-S-isoprenylcysteine O-methyltransferase Ste14
VAGRPGRAYSGAATAVAMGAYLALVAACLRQWGSPEPWTRLDVFSVSALGFSVLMGAQQLWLNARLATEDARAEAFGMTYDPGLSRGIGLLAAAELAVFLDYGQLRLLPALARPALQWTGLALYAAALALMHAVDVRLARHFRAGRPALLTDGPFHFVRHPRYAALLLSRAAFALAFASAIAWALLPGWVAVLLRRIRREEAHLRAGFGEAYESYVGRAAALVPGVY